MKRGNALKCRSFQTCNVITVFPTLTLPACYEGPYERIRVHSSCPNSLFTRCHNSHAEASGNMLACRVLVKTYPPLEASASTLSSESPRDHHVAWCDIRARQPPAVFPDFNPVGMRHLSFGLMPSLAPGCDEKAGGSGPTRFVVSAGSSMSHVNLVLHHLHLKPGAPPRQQALSAMPSVPDAVDS